MNMHVSSSSSRAPHQEPGFFLFCATALVMIVAIIVGGASRLNLIQVTIVEFVSLPLLLWAGHVVLRDEIWRGAKLPLVFCGLALVIPLLQLIPMPPGVWAQLPGHKPAADALVVAGIAPRWRAFSLAPTETLQSILALVPPFAVFLASLALPSKFRRWLAAVIVALALLSVIVGAFQVSGIERLDFYGWGDGFATGFFSNRNHQASLLIISVPLFAYLAVSDRSRMGAQGRIIRMVVLMTGVLLLVAGLVIVKSRAGVLLLAPSLIAALVLVWRSEREDRGGKIAVLIAGLAIIVSLAALFIAGPFLDRLTNSGLSDEARGATSMQVLKLGTHYLPFGSGLGSFVPVYAGNEPVATMGPAFWNHAHNEYAEMWLETGVIGLAAIAAFLIFWLVLTFKAWTAEFSRGAAAASAGAAVIGLLLVHSTVDYPLRTLAIACIFAYAGALLSQPASRSRGRS